MQFCFAWLKNRGKKLIRTDFRWVGKCSGISCNTWVRCCSGRIMPKHLYTMCYIFWRYTRVNKNPSAWNFLSPKPEVTCGTVEIIIRVVLLSLYLRIRGVSLSSTHGWKRRVGNYQKPKTDLALTIQSLTLSWVEAKSLYRSFLTVSRCNPGSWTCARKSLQK